MATEEKFLNVIFDEKANNNERTSAIKMLSRSLGGIDRAALVEKYLKLPEGRSTTKKTVTDLETDLMMMSSQYFTVRTQNEALKSKINRLKSIEFSNKILNKVGEMPLIFLMGWSCALLPWQASLWIGLLLLGYLYISFNFDLRRLKD